MVELRQTDTHQQLILAPNRSLSWHQAKWIMIVMIFIVMVIALAWSFVGAWLVLPFAGVEVGLFAFLLYRVTRNTYLQQVVTFTDKEILIETGINKRMSCESIDTLGLEVFYQETERNWRNPTLLLINQGLVIKVGEFLNSEDMEKLKSHFESLGFATCRTHWWKR